METGREAGKRGEEEGVRKRLTGEEMKLWQTWLEVNG